MNRYPYILSTSTYFHIYTEFSLKWQGWEFPHPISERIIRFLPKNERMSYSLKKMSDSLIRSFFQ